MENIVVNYRSVCFIPFLVCVCVLIVIGSQFFGNSKPLAFSMFQVAFEWDWFNSMCQMLHSLTRFKNPHDLSLWHSIHRLSFSLLHRTIERLMMEHVDFPTKRLGKKMWFFKCISTFINSLLFDNSTRHRKDTPEAQVFRADKQPTNIFFSLCLYSPTHKTWFRFKFHFTRNKNRWFIHWMHTQNQKSTSI